MRVALQLWNELISFVFSPRSRFSEAAEEGNRQSSLIKRERKKKRKADCRTAKWVDHGSDTWISLVEKTEKQHSYKIYSVWLRLFSWNANNSVRYVMYNMLWIEQTTELEDVSTRWPWKGTCWQNACAWRDKEKSGNNLLFVSCLRRIL